MGQWAHEIIVGFIALLGFAVTYGTLRGAVLTTIRNHSEWLDRLSRENTSTHKDLYERIEVESNHRNAAFVQQAESIQAHYVTKRECEIMHLKHGANGGSLSKSREA